MRRSLEAVLRMRAATIAAPKPLSMLTTETPGELDTRADSSGVMPCRAAPYPTLVGTATYHIGTHTFPSKQPELSHYV